MDMGTRILALLIVPLSALVLAGTPQSKEQADMTTVRVRYMVNELDPAVLHKISRFSGQTGEQAQFCHAFARQFGASA